MATRFIDGEPNGDWPTPKAGRRWRVTLRLLLLVLGIGTLLRASSTEEMPAESVASVVPIQGKFEVLTAGATDWLRLSEPVDLKAGWTLRTLANSRVSVRLRNHSIISLGPHSRARFEAKPRGVLTRLFRGVLSFFHREGGVDCEVEGPEVAAVIFGTEFVFEVEPDGTSRLTMYDGRVALSGGLVLTNGETALTQPGQAPKKTAAIPITDLRAIEWNLYYPAVLVASDLPDALPAAAQPAWELYRQGDFPAALAAYPADREPGTPLETLCYAALLLSAGNVAEAESRLGREGTEVERRLASALRRLIRTVRLQDRSRSIEGIERPGLASEWLALSYQAQSRADLALAREAARRATELAPGSGLTWARLAELEFAFGRLKAVEASLARALELSPRHAQAQALRGFVLAARNRSQEATAAFDRALALDPALGDAWLGRGLTRLQRGDDVGGRLDLEMAAAREPQRALLRSYLAKAFAALGFTAKARHELELAKAKDPRDPTAWLYSALLEEQANRPNVALDELHRSLELNDQRRLFRSRLMLDQDRAVREANLARLYADAGLADFAVLEAARAVDTDYANGSAHLFLANSYQQLRDLRLVNLRYETSSYSEFLVAQLLSPVGATPLSPTVSQNEYGRFFDRNGLGLATDTRWTSNGDWWESVAQHGRLGGTAYALDFLYRSEVGQRPNADLEQYAVSTTLQQAVTPSDTLLVQATVSQLEGGDLAQYHDPDDANPVSRRAETLDPLGLVGWRHEWQPGMQTLAAVSPWRGDQAYANPLYSVLRTFSLVPGEFVQPDTMTVPLEYQNEFQGVSAEVQQLARVGAHQWVVGLRTQTGEFTTRAELALSSSEAAIPDQVEKVSSDWWRIGVYVYDFWELHRRLRLTAGVAYDCLEQPPYLLAPPLTGDDASQAQVSPKVGLVWCPFAGTSLRTAWTRSLGGIGLDQSLRLEPVQVAGFNQAYRSLMPESLVGAVPGQQYETLGLAWDQRFASRTWLSVQAEHLSSQSERDLGAFEYRFSDFQYHVVAHSQSARFTERSLHLTLGQLLGDCWSLSARYHLAEADLDLRLPALARSETAMRGLITDERSRLHQLELDLRFSHPSGFFGHWSSLWTEQSNWGDAAHFAGDDVWRHDLWIGWRWAQRRAELSVGVLNLLAQDYRLHPLNYYLDGYRDRTVAIQARFTLK